MNCELNSNRKLVGKENENTRSDETIRLSTLIDNIRVGVLIEDQNRNVLIANQLFCDLLSLNSSPNELCEKSHIQLITTLKERFVEKGVFTAMLQKAHADGQKIEGEHLRLKDGRIIEIDLIPISSETSYHGRQWNIRDVTERYRTRSQLQQNEKKYLSIIDNMQLGLVETNANGNIMNVNNSFCELLGYNNEELRYKDINQLEHEETKERNAISFSNGKQLLEICLRTKENGYLWTVMSVAPFEQLNGETHNLRVFMDISDQKQMEKQLITAKNEAEQAREAEQQFLAQMSHEIRTPLNAVIGMAHLLLETAPTDEQLAYLKTLNNATNILHGLISDILDLSKIESGAVEVRQTPFDINALLESIGQTFYMKSMDKPLELKMEIDDTIDQYLIGDEMLLTQILLNLVSNAFKFTEEGIVRIALNKIDEDENEMDISLIIEDTGIGISEENLESIFDNFRQAGRDIGIKYGGTGLGLSITKKLVDILEGTIKVMSKEGEGTEFNLEFTFQKSHKPLEKEESKPAPVKEAIHKESKFLVVEDNAMNQSYVRSILSKFEVHLDFADNGVAGVELAKNKVYDIILMDIRMPEMDGYEASRQIRNTDNPNAKTPIVALTASALEVEKNKAFDQGMNAFLTKPFTPADLIGLISEHMNKKTEHSSKTGEFTFHEAFDSKQLEDFYEGDMETILLMFESFISGVIPEFPLLRKHADNKDWEEVRSLAHKFLPTFAMVGLLELHNDLRKIEEQCKSGNYDNIGEEVSKVSQKLDELEPIIVQELERINKHVSQQ